MTTLPSFVELMASLGIDPEARKPNQDSTSSSSSSPSSPKLLTIPTSAPARSKSSPSLREQASRSRSARYSPYSSTFVHSSNRRGSVSSMSSSSSDMSERASSSSPSLSSSSPRIRKRANNKLTVNVFGSSTDLSANTPISSYVRRKTPGTSPTSPTYPLEIPDESSRASPMPFTIPTLPPFFPRSASSETFPITPSFDLDDSSSEQSSPSSIFKPLQASLEFDIMSRRSRFHTGIRISTQPRPADVSGKYPGQRVVHVA